MCGIFGLVIKAENGLFKDEVNVIGSMAIAGAVRGLDSVGIFAATKKKEFVWAKDTTPAQAFLETEAAQSVLKEAYSAGKVVIGHNRAATRGSVTIENAHPFVHDHLIGVHNGTIYSGLVLKDEYEVDSEALYAELAQSDASEVFPKINGAFACVWYDQKANTINFLRNKERPLHILEFERGFLIGSEAGMLQWMAARHNLGIPDKRKLLYFKENVHYSLNLEEYNYKVNNTFFHTEDLPEKKSVYLPVSTTGQKTTTPATTDYKAPTVGMPRKRSKVHFRLSHRYSDIKNGVKMTAFFGRTKLSEPVFFRTHSADKDFEFGPYYSGEVVGYEMINNRLHCQIKVRSVKVVEEEQEELKDAVKGAVSTLGKSSEGPTIRKTRNGHLFTKDLFLSKVKNGCTACTQQIDWEDAEDCYVHTQGICCPDCTVDIEALAESAKRVH